MSVSELCTEERLGNIGIYLFRQMHIMPLYVLQMYNAYPSGNLYSVDFPKAFLLPTLTAVFGAIDEPLASYMLRYVHF